MSHAAAAEASCARTCRAEPARETVLAEAPDAADGLFRVPRVLGG